MIQQVNLYTEALRPRKTVLSLNQMASALTVVVVVLVVAGVWQFRHWQQGHDKLLQQKKELAQIENSLDALRQKAKLWVKSEALEAANGRLAKQLEKYEAFTERLGQNLAVNTAGYSPILVGLAKHKREDLWLTRLAILAERDGFLLEGETLSPQAVPEYLQALKVEPVFGGRNFSVFELMLQENKLPYEFKLKAGKVDEK